MKGKKYGRDRFFRQNFAHRGLHDISSGIPENSLAAFEAAASSGYGCELDVHLSKDGQVIVFHDDSLERVCQISGNVCDYSYDELHSMQLMGTGQTIPLFTDVLKIYEGTGLPMIVELKTGSRNDELCRKTYDILKSRQIIYCIESFDPFIVKWFRDNAPEVFRGQLAQPAEYYPDSISRLSAWLLSGCRLSFLNKPDFIAYKNTERPERILKKRQKGVLLFAWTSREPGRDQALNDAVIFEGYRPSVRY